MELVTTFKSLSKSILKKYDGGMTVTLGILIADYRQTEAREYILNYLNRFDEKSDKYIDFYLPGYYMFSEESKNEWKKRSHYHMCISRHCTSREPIFITRLQENFYFDEYLFEDFLNVFEQRTGIAYTYNPMLVLVEVSSTNYYGQLEFQNKMVIDLDNGTSYGVRRSGVLFDEIFRIALHEVKLDKFQKALRMRYVKGAAVATIASILDGNIIEALADSTEEIRKYRITRFR